MCPAFPGRLPGGKSRTAALLRPNRGFSKQILPRVPSARHQITGLVWKSSDGGQQMHRKCFWSNKMAREQGGMEGEKKVGVIASTCAFWRQACAFVLGCVLMNAECWEAFFGTASRFPTTETDGGSNPTVSRLLCVSARPGAICDGAGGRAGCLWCDIVHWDAVRWEYVFFMNREEGWGNSCMPDQLALTAIVKFFFFLLSCFYMAH